MQTLGRADVILKQAIEVRALVLKKVLRGESGMLFYLLSPNDGIVTCMKRISAKKSSPLPDLFDVATFTLSELKSSDLKFIQDFEIHESRLDLAKRYDSFLAMTNIAAFILSNGKDLESHKKLYEIFDAAINTVLKNAPQTPVLIKFFYVLMKDEGYPVKESFAHELSVEERKDLSYILSTPSLECEISDNTSNKLLKKLSNWINIETDFKVPQGY